MQYFLIKVQTIDTDLILLAFTAGANFARLQQSFRLGNVARSFECEIALCATIEDTEEIVVRAGHDRRIVAAPAALEFIKNTIVLIQ